MVVCSVLVLASCAEDGRNLRPPPEGQTAPPMVETTTTLSAPTQPGGARLLLLLTPTMTPEGPMPDEHTCDGAGTSPPLSWSGVPQDATSLALVAEDLEDDSTVRWLVAGLDPAITGIAAGRLPASAVAGGGEAPTWNPPCPTEDEPHTIVFTLYVLGSPVDVSGAATLDEALERIQLASVEQAAATTTALR